MTADPVRQAYAAYPYGGGVVRQSHPARLAAVAGLYGLPTPDVRQARILEVGCSRGFNLLPWAEQFPAARLVGIDFSAAEIAEGKAIAAAAGLTNVELIETDLRDYRPGAGSFDYIIAHGFFSWVPDDVKAALLALCARALSPDGLAFISYNTYPGWRKDETIRDLLLMEVGDAADPVTRMKLARATLSRLERLYAGRKDPHGLEMQALLAEKRRAREGTFYHDDLSPVNDPCYFSQFAAWAAEHGLGFVGEAEFEMTSGHQLRAADLGLPDDRLKAEQWADYASNRTLRCSLLAHGDRVARLAPSPHDGLRQGCFGANVRPAVGMPDLTAGISVTFKGRHGVSFQSTDPIVKALYTVLANVWPRRMDFDDLRDRVERLLVTTHTAPNDAIEPALLARLLDGCGRRLLDFLSGGTLHCTNEVSPRPRTSRLNRALAQRDQPVSTLWHEPVETTPEILHLIRSLDGERGNFTPAERKDLERLAQAGLLLS